MVTVNRGSELVDPLQGHSCVFPKTVEVSEVSFDRQLGSVHNHLKSIVPVKLRDQAKIIVAESSKKLSSITTLDRVSMEKLSEVLPVMAEVNPRNRRPGLDRKRARFSLKPDSPSQPAVSVEPTLDFKNFKDPEEFFRAYERHENAKREIQRVMGVLTDSELQNTSMPVRPRRPVISRPDKRRVVKYKHLYPMDDSEANNSVLSSQEQFDSSILIPEDRSSQQESGRGFASEETQFAVGSVSAEEDKIDEILDELLSCNGEELEGDGAVNILRERLQIKPIELPKLNLPDFPDMPKINLNPIKFRFSSLSNMMHKQGPESSSIRDVGSPNPPKSPFATLPLLNRRISRSIPSNDPFSPDGIDFEPVTEPSCIEQVRNEFADVERQPNAESPLLEKDESIEVSKTNTSKQYGALDIEPSDSHLPGADDMYINKYNSVTYDKSADPTYGSVQASETNVEDEVRVEDKQQETVVPVQPCNTVDLALNNGLEENTKINREQSEVPLDQKQKAKSQSRKASKKRLINPAESNYDGTAQANETNAQDKVEVVPSQRCNTADLALDDGLEEHTEINRERSEIPLNKKRKAKPQPRKASKSRESDRRKSLAGAGTKWESGVRRSTRFRCRPLEYWNGERLLYGRVHQSLPTVIGLKYASPGNSSLKVKSLVSDEHKGLVELAALH